LLIGGRSAAAPPYFVGRQRAWRDRDSVALVIIIIAKFVEGAWLTFYHRAGLIGAVSRIKRHYQRIAREVDQPVQLNTEICSTDGDHPYRLLNRVVERACRFGLQISDDITAVHVRTEKGDDSGCVNCGPKMWRDRQRQRNQPYHDWRSFTLLIGRSINQF